MPTSPCRLDEIQYFQINSLTPMLGTNELCRSPPLVVSSCNLKNSIDNIIELKTPYTFLMRNPYKSLSFTELSGLEMKALYGSDTIIDFRTFTFTSSNPSITSFRIGTLSESKVVTDSQTCLDHATYDFEIEINQPVDSTLAIQLTPLNVLDISLTSCNRISKVLYNGDDATATATLSVSSSSITVRGIFTHYDEKPRVSFSLGTIRNPSYKVDFKWAVSLVFTSSGRVYYGNKGETNSVSINKHYSTRGILNVLNQINRASSNYSFELSYPMVLPLFALSRSNYLVAVKLPPHITCDHTTLTTSKTFQFTLEGRTRLADNTYGARINFVEGIGFTEIFTLLIVCTNPVSTESFDANAYLYYNEESSSHKVEKIIAEWNVIGQTSIGNPFASVIVDPSQLSTNATIDVLTLIIERKAFAGQISSVRVALSYLGGTAVEMKLNKHKETFQSGSMSHSLTLDTNEKTATRFVFTFTGLVIGIRPNEQIAFHIRTYTKGSNDEEFIVDEDHIVIEPSCNYPCSTCLDDSPNKCTTCHDPYIIIPEKNNCVLINDVKEYVKCPENMIPDPDNITCLNCYRTCAHCFGTDSNQCTKCDVDNRLRIRFYLNGECVTLCPKEYMHNYEDYKCERIDTEIYELLELYLCILWTLASCLLGIITIFIGKPGKTSIFCTFYSLLSLSEFLTRLTLFVNLFIDLRHVPNVATSLTIILMTHTMFWSYKYFHFNPMTNMRSFKPYYENHKCSILVIQILSAFAGSNVMLLLGSGLLRISTLSQGMNNHLIYRVFSFKSSWAPAIFNACQAILTFVNLFLYYKNSPVFCLSIVSCITSLTLVFFYIAETILIKSMRKSLDHLTFKAIERKEAKIENEIQKVKLLRSEANS